jgi:hypothetical protein
MVITVELLSKFAKQSRKRANAAEHCSRRFQNDLFSSCRYCQSVDFLQLRDERPGREGAIVSVLIWGCAIRAAAVD